MDERGRFVLRKADRKGLSVPDFHALRHTAAMEWEQARGSWRVAVIVRRP